MTRKENTFLGRIEGMFTFRRLYRFSQRTDISQGNQFPNLLRGLVMMEKESPVV
ncbi:MAG: hypothetical protein IKK15_01840 [Akkermansia sp.]|nr:hypothetical protein [Akkermansia sp.]